MYAMIKFLIIAGFSYFIVREFSWNLIERNYPNKSSSLGIN